jgi:hypothetical protein
LAAASIKQAATIERGLLTPLLNTGEATNLSAGARKIVNAGNRRLNRIRKRLKTLYFGS